MQDDDKKASAGPGRFQAADDVHRIEPEALRALSPYLQKRRYRAGQVLWTKGETSGRVVLLDRGRVKAGLALLLPEGDLDSTLIIDVPSPIHDFAGDLGMTPETFARAVTRLADSGVLHRLASPRLQVLDADRLRSIAAGRDE